MDDLTNRILTVGLGFLWVFILLLIILLTWGAPDQSIEQLGDLAGYLEDNNTTETKLIITFGGLILILMAALLIIFEIVPAETGTLKVETLGVGQGLISTDEAVLRLEAELRTIEHVNEVQVTVLGRGKKAEVSLDLHVAAEADLARMVDEACQRASTLMQDRMGVALAGTPKAQIHYRELRVGQPGAPTPAAEQPVSPPVSPAPASPTFTTEPTDDVAETQQEDRPAGS